MSRPAFTPDSSVVAEVMASPNHGERSDGRRPDMILLHYTGMPDADAALALLCAPGGIQGSNVSAHYFVFEDGRSSKWFRKAAEPGTPANHNGREKRISI